MVYSPYLNLQGQVFVGLLGSTHLTSSQMFFMVSYDHMIGFTESKDLWSTHLIYVPLWFTIGASQFQYSPVGLLDPGVVQIHYPSFHSFILRS